MILHTNNTVPHITKYMGSKKNLIDFVIAGINEIYTDGATICDLFAGTCVLSGIVRNQSPIISNDIQQYSSVLAQTYLQSYPWGNHPDILQEITYHASSKVQHFKDRYPELVFDYNREFTMAEFIALEKQQQDLIKIDFDGFPHLFLKNYSGTYWAFEQCLWIDAIRSVTEEFYRETPFYNAIISSLMFAMSYNSQSTGHYAQYRDATSQSSMEDILIYRRKEILPYFTKKFEELQTTFTDTNDFEYQVVSQDYRDCLDNIPPNTIVYADPPYCFVHYSRFYHAIETLVRYDYPDVLYKGRYRTDRHQSPFCIRTQVQGAFREMFSRIVNRESHLVLSYSDTGMINLDELIELANEEFGDRYEVNVRYQDYLHSTMGRKEDKNRNVQESLIIARRRA